MQMLAEELRGAAIAQSCLETLDVIMRAALNCPGFAGDPRLEAYEQVPARAFRIGDADPFAGANSEHFRGIRNESRGRNLDRTAICTDLVQIARFFGGVTGQTVSPHSETQLKNALTLALSIMCAGVRGFKNTAHLTLV